jgi:hypothetical protein
MTELRRELFGIGNDAEVMASGYQSFIRKLPGVAGRLAIVFQMTSNPTYSFHEIKANVVRCVRTLIMGRRAACPSR